MRKGFFHSVAVLLLGSGLAVARSPGLDVPAARQQEPALLEVHPDDRPAAPARDSADKPPAPARTAAENHGPPATQSTEKIAVPTEQQGEKIPAPVQPPASVKPSVTVMPALVEPPRAGSADCPPPAPASPCPPPAPPRFWSRAEFLFWWIQNSHTPPLVTSGASLPAPLGAGGPGTTIFGGSINNEERLGGRFTAGYWLTKDQTLAFEGSFLFLGQRSERFFAGSLGNPVLARPFIDARTGAVTSALVTIPGIQTGSVAASLSSELWGAEANARAQVLCGDCYHVSLLSGFRYLDLHEYLAINQRTSSLAPAGALGNVSVQTEDRFDARNYFYGGQWGAEAEICRGRFSVNLLGKIAIGDNHQIVGVRGATTQTSAVGTTATIPSGFLVLPSNFGRYNRNEFAVLPEAGITVGYQVTRNLRATLGYTFLYLSNAVRPGDQIDPVRNTTQVAPLLGAPTLFGPARPAFSFKETDFWAQGVNIGLEFRY